MMKDNNTYNRICNRIILGLSVILAILSLVIALNARKEISALGAAMEEELNARISQEFTVLERELKAEQTEYEESLDKRVENKCRDIHVRSVAHRGASEFAPENTLPAFRLAGELGFSCVEADIRFTSDGIPVCLHDPSINRTSNGTGNIEDMTLNEVKQYDFGAWKDSMFERTEIPTFEEFLLLCKNIGLHPYIEMKEGTAGQIRALVDTVNRYGMRGRVTWISFDISLLSVVRWYDDEARLGYLIDDFFPSEVNEICALRSGKNDVFLNSCVYNDWVVEECQKAKLPLEIWTVNQETMFADLDPYITGVTSNGLRYGQFLFSMGTAG